MQISLKFQSSGQSLSNCGVNFEMASQFLMECSSFFIVMINSSYAEFKLIRFHSG